MVYLLDFGFSFCRFLDRFVSFFKRFRLFDRVDYNSLSDTQIIEKILNGQKDLFEIIVNRYSDKIFRYLYYQFSFRKDIAEELIQEVFLKVWRNLEKVDFNKNFENWIFTITHNLAVDWIKKDAINDEISLDNKNFKDYTQFNDCLEDDYKKKLLERLISQLDFKYREVLILYYFEGKSYEEIADLLGTTKNTIGSWVKRAKDKLKQIIEKDPVLKQALEI